MTEEQKKLCLLMGTAQASAVLLSMAVSIGKSLGWNIEKSIDVLIDNLKEYRKSNNFSELLKRLKEEDKR